MIHLDLVFRTLTPMFLGDAEQHGEWRAASLKGALRWWYRALDPHFRKHEDLLFGGSGQGYGQSLMLLHPQDPGASGWRWDAARARRQSRNGLVYLGYPFQMPGNESRTAIPAAKELKLRIVLPRPPRDNRLRCGVIATWWLLGTFGAMGTRSRRGFGSLILTDWRISETNANGSTMAASLENEWQDELKRLPQLNLPRDAQTWRKEAQRGLDQCRAWFDQWPNGQDEDVARHPHLGHEFRWKLLKRGFRGREAWEEALNHAGRLMQDFRQRRDPDYSDVKRHLQRAGQLRHAPDRSTFGMPLTFRYGSVPQAGPIEFVPSGEDLDNGPDGDRHASLLLLKLVRVGDDLHPLFLRMAGDVPGQHPRAAIARRGSRGLPLEPARRNAMDEFFDSLEAV